MNKIFNKIFFKNIGIKEYLAITINKPIQEHVYLKNENYFLDISETHWLLCLEPVMFGVWVNTDQLKMFSEKQVSKIYFTDAVCNSENAEQKSLAILTVQLYNNFNNENGTLLLLQVKQSKIKHLNSFKTLLIFFLHYKKPAISFQKFKVLVSAFSYPRKVCLISFQTNDYYNIFPMDLLGEIKSCNKYIFGLRHTNAALAKIIEAKKIVVCDVSFKYKEIIYQLSKHHGTKPPSIDSLPFKVLRSESFNFPIPVFANNYKEIQILNTLNLGSQMLLWGEVVHEVFLRNSNGNLFHLHFLMHMHYQQRKIDAGYTIV